ncbi:hypothetical protein [Candidatus Amarolinea dominans]|uniref:hypothetical protein n=1 Tax=Candidatus Amarolinea dominans TaxID=3140696 RepID=UPI003134D0CD|nr:hypothetical protein [Anaerolineae bacterium]
MDDQALRILFDTYWSPKGWKLDSKQHPKSEDFAYARAKGVMFEPVSLNHAQALQRLSHCIQKLTRRGVADAFLASLSTRRLDWRSALGSFAVFQHLPDHHPQGQTYYCTCCGFYLDDETQDWNVLNFERFKWGGVRHDKVVYAIMDLEQFLQASPPTPNQEDIQIFHRIIAAITTAPLHMTSATLQSQFATALKSNKAERERIIAMMGFCGILRTPDHPDFSNSFVHVTQRALPQRRFVDMSYPACWWHGADGIDQERLMEYFSHVF